MPLSEQMLKNLLIRNYALIEDLNMDFDDGFSVITGETGAGKSILLGALSLILGERADASALRDKHKKCIVEGTFRIGSYRMRSVFDALGLDYDDTAVLRREINPGAKSRAFVNDTPVTLAILRVVGTALVDIHSQHENLQLESGRYQISLLDAFAGNDRLLTSYTSAWEKLCAIAERLCMLREEDRNARNDRDYIAFQLNELREAKLVDGEQERLEEEMRSLGHAAEIRARVAEAQELLDAGEQNAVRMARQAGQLLEKAAGWHSGLAGLSGRLKSARIELEDIGRELEQSSLAVSIDPARLEEAGDRLDLIHGLLQKHRAGSVKELLHLEQDLNRRLDNIAFTEEEIAKLTQEAEEQRGQTWLLAKRLYDARARAAAPLEKATGRLLARLGMPDAHFSVTVTPGDITEMTATGSDKVACLFTANKGGRPAPLGKVASGGELSRLMLALKYLISEKKKLPVIVFDEVDTGVSGEIADKMGGMMQAMSKTMQVVAVTHLPQIAGKGLSHYLVYKTTTRSVTTTHIRRLSGDERVTAVASMLSGEKLTEAARKNAEELMGRGDHLKFKIKN